MASYVLLPLCCHGVHNLSFPWELCSLVSPMRHCKRYAPFWCLNFWPESLCKVSVLSSWLTSSCVGQRLSSIVKCKCTWGHGAFVIYITQVFFFLFLVFFFFFFLFLNFFELFCFGFFISLCFFFLPQLLHGGQLDELILEPKYNRLFIKKKNRKVRTSSLRLCSLKPYSWVIIWLFV